MRRIAGLLVALAGLCSPALAEITWYDAGGSYVLSGAALLRLKSELPAEVQDSLKAIRNQSFADEAEFRAALDAALPTEALKAAWADRLVALAQQAGGAFGVEGRDLDLTTIYVTGADHQVDANAFTSRSWLSQLPLPDDTTWLKVEPDGNCLKVGTDDSELFRLCDPQVGPDGSSVMLETSAAHIVGLGQEFQAPGDTVAERAGFVRHGSNVMTGFNGGANGNTLFPVAYFDTAPHPFALVLDNRYQQEWDLTKSPYPLKVNGGTLRLQVLEGPTLANLRRQFMDLAGHPPVPRKQMFGLWISEYGYENWAEVDDKIRTLKAAGFPLSGIVLDLYWFGGIASGSPVSRMGSLTWDETRFPDPKGKIAELEAQRIGTMLIEESYISAGLSEFGDLAAHHGLAHDASGTPLLVSNGGNWWGKGGMVDWTTAEARDFWHDHRRQALINMGVMGHWTDLGEPEMTSPDFRYGPDNMTEAEVHQSYNVLWLEGIFDGYRRNSPNKRPFMMSRSGGIGMQAYGAAMWSGDTGGDFGSLVAQMPQQQHMMWSGLDYYGSDIGGFHRGALRGFVGSAPDATDELYTQWLAYSALFEVPVRPHTENLCDCKETAPDRIGDVASNLANLQLRYALLPYYYSLAYQAWLGGEPVFPSLDYWYPEDPKTRGLGHVKMVGSELVGAAVAAFGANDVPIYLPAGKWYAFRSGAELPSSGQTFTAAVHRDGKFELPLFARDGAIVPMADGVLRVFGDAPNAFDWFDDDGISTAYQQGGYQQIHVTLDGHQLMLSREKGDGIVPKALVWTRPDPATTVYVDGLAATFTQEGSTITVALPAFESTVIVEAD